MITISKYKMKIKFFVRVAKMQTHLHWFDEVANC